MDFINDKLTSLTAPAISRVNEFSKRSAEKRRKNSLGGQQIGNNMTTIIKSKQFSTSSSLAGGIPFGGDTTNYYNRLEPPPPPPIGFRTDLLESTSLNRITDNSSSIKNGNDNQQNEQLTTSRLDVSINQNPSQQQQQLNQSDSSLYDGDTWSRIWFQRVMVLSLIRLLLFIRKVYEDFHATKTYNSLPNHFGHFLISGATLFLPTIIFTIYRIGRYLQIVLPEKRTLLAIKDENNLPYPQTTNAKIIVNSSREPAQDKDIQLIRQALIASASASASASSSLPATTTTTNNNNNNNNNEDDGLVTARQSPMNLDEFQDSKSQQENFVGSSNKINTTGEQQLNKTMPNLPINDKDKNTNKNEEKEFRERVEIEKLGNLPDRDTVRIVIGASEQFLHGILFIFWQLKRQVDVMGYLVERACLWRKPRDSEKDELGRLRTGSDGLEWFQDFYAAFLAILAQVYTLGQYWTITDNNSDISSKQKAGTLFAATSNNSPLGSLATFESSELSISNSAKVLSDTLRQQILANSQQQTLNGKDLLIMSELIVSSAIIVSLLVAVRRKDDGPLTLALSMLGWGSIFASRIIIIALSFVHIKWQIMLALILLHIFGITGWIYRIALDSHNDKKSEQVDEIKWRQTINQEELMIEDAKSNPEQAVELTATTTTTNDNDNNLGENSKTTTSKWTHMEHFILISQIFILFSIPSLFYWPIMFNLKTHYRPFKYLVLIMTENFLLIPIVWYAISSLSSSQSQQTIGQWYLLGSVASFSIVGFIFISLYIACKPSLTEYFARADELFNEAEKSGIYFEFCSRVFKMPDLQNETFKRLMNQTEEQIEVEINLEE